MLSCAAENSATFDGDSDPFDDNGCDSVEGDDAELDDDEYHY
jgi:hypothetical protein